MHDAEVRAAGTRRAVEQALYIYVRHSGDRPDKSLIP